MIELKRLHSSGRVADFLTIPALAPPPGRPADVLLRLMRRHGLALAVVVLPVLIAMIGFGLVAADRYAADASFVVRTPSRPQMPALGGLAQGAGIGRANDDAHAVIHFIRSRDALDVLVRDHDFRAMVGRPEADIVSRFPRPFGRSDFEALYERFQSLVSVAYDPATGISTLEVRLFRPEDAARVASALLSASEGLVNRLNARARQDTVEAAEREVELARARAAQARDAVTRFRAREGLLDPVRTSVAVEQNIGKLAYEVAQTNAQISELRRSSPQSPQIAALASRMRSLQAEIDLERAKIGGLDQPLAPRLAEYERLVLESGFAEKAQEAALNGLEAARIEAVRQQLYLERVVEPRVPDYPAYPRRLAWIALVAAVAGAAYVVLRALAGNLRAHEPR